MVVGKTFFVLIIWSCAKLIYQPSQQFLLFCPNQTRWGQQQDNGNWVHYLLDTVGNLYVWNWFFLFVFLQNFLWSWAKLLILYKNSMCCVLHHAQPKRASAAPVAYIDQHWCQRQQPMDESSYLCHICGEWAEIYPNNHRVGHRVMQATSLSEGTHTIRSHTHTQDSLESPIQVKSPCRHGKHKHTPLNSMRRPRWFNNSVR